MASAERTREPHKGMVSLWFDEKRGDVRLRNPKVVQFVKTHAGDAELLRALDSLVETACELIERATPSLSPEEYVTKLEERSKRGLEEALREEREVIMDGMRDAVQSAVREGNETVVRLQSESNRALGIAQESARTTQDAIRQLVQQGNQRRMNNSKKGAEAEEAVTDVICRRLRSTDGYSVEEVHGESMGCDIHVKRAGWATGVRVEVKSIGEYNGYKVPSRDVQKFQRDMSKHPMDHGVFVSMHGGIVGYGGFAFEQLPSGKFAIFLSEAEKDLDHVAEMVSLLFKLEETIARDEEEDEDEKESGVSVPAERMAAVKKQVEAWSANITSARVYMRETCKLLDGMHLDLLESLLLGGEPELKYKCEHCGKSYKTRSGRSEHISQGRCPVLKQKTAKKEIKIERKEISICPVATPAQNRGETMGLQI